MSELALVPLASLTDDDLADLYGFPIGVRMNFVTSLDGAVALNGYSAGLSGPADKRVFGILRMLSDAVLVGAGTLRHERYRALRLDPVRRQRRKSAGEPDYPTLAIVSRSLDLDPQQAAFADAPVRPIVLTCESAPRDRRESLARVADVITLGSTSVDLTAGLAELRARGLTRVLCEGGPHLFGALTAEDLVDELCLTLSPLLTGPGEGRITAGQLSQPRPMRLAHTLTADSTLFLHYTR